MPGYSDYIIYVDESGDHGLESIDPNYPVFVLAFCIFHKNDYTQLITPALQQFKFKYFGHDMVVLHEYEIRKAKNEFSILLNEQIREPFMEDLKRLIAEAPFTLIASVIRKRALKKKYVDPANPYHIALGFGLERAFLFLKSKGQKTKTTHVVVEKRGRREDDALELEFRRVCNGSNYLHNELPFQIVFADKKINSSGLQLADLLARPIGRAILNPNQENRAYEVIEKKFYCNAQGKKEGWGLKCFP
ncbi:MAG: DUF3800 domain-containing protein [Thermodesulfobacteriota bacterium]